MLTFVIATLVLAAANADLTVYRNYNKKKAAVGRETMVTMSGSGDLTAEWNDKASHVCTDDSAWILWKAYGQQPPKVGPVEKGNVKVDANTCVDVPAWFNDVMSSATRCLSNPEKC